MNPKLKIPNHDFIKQNIRNLLPDVNPREVLYGSYLDIYKLTGDVRHDVWNLKYPESHPKYNFEGRYPSPLRLSISQRDDLMHQINLAEIDWMDENGVDDAELDELCEWKIKIILACYGLTELPDEK